MVELIGTVVCRISTIRMRSGSPSALLRRLGALDELPQRRDVPRGALEEHVAVAVDDQEAHTHVVPALHRTWLALDHPGRHAVSTADVDDLLQRLHEPRVAELAMQVHRD